MTMIPMTAHGKVKLEEELKLLKFTERPKVIHEIATARAHGDLSENAEYDAAKEKQSFIEGRINELEDKLSRAQVIDPKEVKTDRIVFGATVEVRDENSEEVKTFQIVGTDEADVKAGKLSIESPVVRQLLNKSVGDTVTVKVPKGDIDYEILAIRYE